MSYTNYNQAFRRDKFSEPAQSVAASNFFTPTVDQKYMLGCRFDLNDGRSFRYCKDGGSGLTRALMASSAVPIATLEEEVQTAQATAAGSIKFDVLITTSSGIATGDLIDGYMWVNKSPTDGSTIGDLYIIKDNKFTTSDTVLNLTIADEGGIRQAISATDEISIVKNRCRDVLTNTADITSAPIGVPPVDVTASFYFWAQYRGITAMLVDTGDAPVVGAPAGTPTGTASVAGTVGVGANDGTDATWGVYVSAGAADEVSLVDLMIP